MMHSKVSRVRKIILFSTLVILVLAGLFFFRSQPLERVLNADVFAPDGMMGHVLRHEMTHHSGPMASVRNIDYDPVLFEEIMSLLSLLHVRRALPQRSPSSDNAAQSYVGFFYIQANSGVTIIQLSSVGSRMYVNGRAYRANAATQRAVLEGIWQLLLEINLLF